MPRARKPQSLWSREEPGTRQPRFSRAGIAEAAIVIADAEGFEAVSMRKVAERLGASTMSLYYYVKTRDELLALMDDALMAEHLLPEVKKRGGKGLLQIALGTADMLKRHPWALSAMRGAAPGPNAMRHAEQCLETLEGTSLSTKEKLTLLAMVDDVVFGHALREAEARTGIDETLAKSLIATGAFPRLQHAYRKGLVEPDVRRLQRALEAVIGAVLPW